MRLFFFLICIFQLLVFSGSPVQAVDFTNFIDIEFVNIDKGKFNMGGCNTLFTEIKQPLCNGTNNDPDTFADELPMHSVEIDNSIQIGIKEVSVAEYKHYINDATVPQDGVKTFTSFNQSHEYAPVVYVSWDDTQKFITWLNKTKPDDDTGKYRLPTEAEWEYIARAGTDTIYFFGNSASELDLYAWYKANSLQNNDTAPHPVGRKKANPWGIYDIYGNVWEWTADYYDDGYYQTSKKVSPTGPEKGRLKTVRGGSWNFDKSYCRTTARESYLPHYRSRSIGFRLIREIKE